MAMRGFHGPAFGFKLGGSGDLTKSNRVWLSKTKIRRPRGSAHPGSKCHSLAPSP